MFTKYAPTPRSFSIISLGVFLLLGFLTGPESSAKDETPDSKKTWHRIQASPFQLHLKTRGLLESRSQEIITFQSEVSEKVRIRSVVQHGTRVVRGATLLHIESEALRRSIAALVDEIELSDLALELETLAVQVADRKEPLQRESIRRRKDHMEQDYQHFHKTEKPQLLTNSRRALERAEFSLEYSLEELHQLKKMYEADDLTEETEEIILKRAQRAAKNARHALEQTRWKQERYQVVSLPRDEEKRASDRTRTRIDLEASLARIAPDKKQRHKNLQKRQRQQAERKELLNRYRRDLEKRHIVSPSDGIVFHGRLREGVWSGKARGLQAGQIIARNQTLMTVVDPSPQNMIAWAVVPESALANLSPGLSGYALLPVDHAIPLPVKLEWISWLPSKPGHYATRFSIQIPDSVGAVRPSMSCQITLIIQEIDKAVSVPTSGLHRDSLGNPFVLLRTPEGKTRRPVRLGRVSGKRQHILSGLAPGDEIWIGPEKSAR
ncbi:MAG: hypothetical protein QF752_03515 [Planctomycetota bacterium]|nr:hypothetical protein [Planctomycetota bacterium]